jgi:hypothetical protein
MARPFDRISFDAFTATGSGPTINDLFATPRIPAHVARYAGRPPYMTDAATQARLQKQGDLE